MLTNELLIAQLFDHQPEAVVWFKPVLNSLSSEQTIIDFEVHYCNIAYTKFMNSTKEKILYKKVIADDFPNDEYTQSIIFQQCCKVMETEEPLEYSYFNTHFKRYFRTLRIKVCGGVLVSTRDTTKEYLKAQEDLKVEIAIQQQAKLLNRIIETSPYGIVLYECIRNEQQEIIDFKAKLYNNKSVELTGFTIEEAGDKTMKELIAIHGDYGFFEQAAQVAQTGLPLSMEYYSKFLKRWLAFSIVKFEDGILLNYIDVTESKSFEQKIKETANELDAIFNTSISAVYAAEVVINAEEAITDILFLKVNESFLQMFNLTYEQIIGRNLNSFSHNNPELIYYINVAMQSDKPVKKQLYYEDLKRWFEFSIVKLNETNVCITLNDTTESVNVKQALEEAVSELQKSNKSLSEFAYVASHDLKEPLRKIRIQSNNLQERFSNILDNEGANYLQRIVSSVTRMETLINDLLTYSQLNKRSEAIEKVSLNKLVQEVLNDLDLVIHETGAVVNYAELPEIKGDKTQLRQLFQNLISNALKFRKATELPVINITTIKVRAEQEQARANPFKFYHHIIITDNGIGFEQEYAERIFKVFERLHGNKEYQGTGIGLAIVQKVVENHHGFIRAESCIGKGSSFTIALPG
jgi:signal transduction histidine kinase